MFYKIAIPTATALMLAAPAAAEMHMDHEFSGVAVGNIVGQPLTDVSEDQVGNVEAIFEWEGELYALVTLNDDADAEFGITVGLPLSVLENEVNEVGTELTVPELRGMMQIDEADIEALPFDAEIS